MQTLPTIEGLSPAIIWYTFVGLVGFGALVVLYGKVRTVFKELKKDKDDERAKEDGTIQGQLDKISKRLDSIDGFMKETNQRFDRDNRRLNALESQSDDISRGIRALARASLAHLQHDITGNHVETLKEAEGMITDYLTDRK